MSLKVLSMTVPDEFKFSEPNKKGIMFAQKSFHFSALVNIDGEVGYLDFDGLCGCPYNGASNPFQWPIKNYYDDPKKDVCGLGHDILFAHGGYVSFLGRNLTFGESNDYIRGSMREAGFSRKEAGTVCMAVKLPFVYLLHWGEKRDKEGMRHYSEVTWRPVHA